jgi:hypothetical protein
MDDRQNELQRNGLVEKSKEKVANFLSDQKNRWGKLSSEERIFATNIGLLVAMGLADIATTHVFLSMGYPETNPIAKLGFKYMGEPATYAIGLVRLAAPIVLLEYLKKQIPIKDVVLSLRLCNAAYAAVVFTNAITPFVLPK